MVSEIAENTGISKERVHHILTEDLGIKKITARWLPRLLTQDRNRIRMNIMGRLTVVLTDLRKLAINSFASGFTCICQVGQPL